MSPPLITYLNVRGLAVFGSSKTRLPTWTRLGSKLSGGIRGSTVPYSGGKALCWRFSESISSPSFAGTSVRGAGSCGRRAECGVMLPVLFPKGGTNGKQEGLEHG